MDAVLSLLRALITAAVSILVALGSLFGPHVVATNPPGAPAQFPVATSTTTTSTQLYPGYANSSAGQLAEVASSSLGKPPPKAAPTPSAALAQLSSATPKYTTEQLNTLARASLVNILCTTQSGGSFNPISGSGVIVDSRGVILTNAHVAQYFLLRDYPTPRNLQCVVRTGSPAQPRYTAEVLYLPTVWISQNASKIASTSPTGTGENDYAFLRITGTTDPGGTLPASFAALPMDGAQPQSGDQMLLAAYPAGFLGGISIALSLYPSSAVATVGQLYSFDDASNVDLFSLGGTVVSQSGSSGGAAVDGAGKLNGIIVTEVPAATTAGRDLRALSISFIDRSLAAAGQGGITGLLTHNPATFAATFNANTAPQEIKALKDALSH